MACLLVTCWAARAWLTVLAPVAQVRGNAALCSVVVYDKRPSCTHWCSRISAAANQHSSGTKQIGLAGPYSFLHKSRVPTTAQLT